MRHAALVGSLAVICSLAPRARADPPPAEPPPFNRLVLAAIDELPVGGGYVWPGARGTHGTTRDLWLGTHRVARAGRGTHCVGATLDVLWRALERLPGGPRAHGVTAPGAARLRRLWFVPEADGLGAAEALPAVGLGARIDLERAVAGDFIQVWGDGWGHAAVFLGWLRDERGALTGVRMWSSQPWTDGLGVTELPIGEGAIDPRRIFIARAAPRRR